MRRGLRLLCVLTMVGLTFVLFYGCGRSTLDGYEPLGLEEPDAQGLRDGATFDRFIPVRDGGRDGGPSCSAASCPNGCCDEEGRCRQGSQLQACGRGGAACADCRDGFDFCDPSSRLCSRTVSDCSAQTCGDGCCASSTVCLGGTNESACGTGGRACAACDEGDEVCDATNRECRPTTCGPENCDGCCEGNRCRTGQAPSLCGASGQACRACGDGETCSPTGAAGGACVATRTCTSSTCPNGCCTLDDRCVDGTSDGACGTGAAACRNCAAQSEICSSRACAPPPPTCTAANCPGCCDGNQVCQAGFLNNRCGVGGARCADCTATSATCSVTTRACTNQPNACPAPYGTCPGNARLPALAQQKVCSLNELADGRAACGPGADSASCNAFYGFLQATNAACGSCLAPFKVPFQQTDGISACLARFVGSSCNRNLACVKACTDQSCAQCSADLEAACRQNVRQPGGECLTESLAAITCAAPALLPGSPGAFCAPPLTGGDAFGRWLETVGRYYCGP